MRWIWIWISCLDLPGWMNMLKLTKYWQHIVSHTRFCISNGFLLPRRKYFLSKSDIYFNWPNSIFKFKDGSFKMENFVLQNQHTMSYGFLTLKFNQRFQLAAAYITKSLYLVFIRTNIKETWLINFRYAIIDCYIDDDSVSYMLVRSIYLLGTSKESAWPQTDTNSYPLHACFEFIRKKRFGLIYRKKNKEYWISYFT